MKVAIPETNGIVSGPGEALQVCIYETDPSSVLLDRYPNPAMNAASARGLIMIRSALDRGATVLIVSGAGPHAVDYLSGKAEAFLAPSMTVDQALKAFVAGNLSRLQHATHNLGDHAH